MGPAPYRRLFVFFVSDRLIDVTDGGADQTAQGAAQDGARAADLLARGDLQGAAVALRRPAFHVGDRDPLVRSRPVGARLLFGIEFRLGR